MTQGLQVFDASGQLVLDGTTRAARIRYSIETGTSNGSQSVPLSSDGGEAFFFVIDNSADQMLANVYAYPNVTLSGGVLSWSFVDFTYMGSAAPRRSVTIQVGTY